MKLPAPRLLVPLVELNLDLVQLGLEGRQRIGCLAARRLQFLSQFGLFPQLRVPLTKSLHAGIELGSHYFELCFQIPDCMKGTPKL